MRRTSCAGCESDRLVTFLNLGHSALADLFPSSPHEREAWYPLEVAVCIDCWLVQLLEIVPDELLFGQGYAFFTGSSPSLVEHYRAYADQMLEEFPEHCRNGVVEIASNDGTLLRFFMDAGCPVLGVDPALPPAEHAAKQGIPTRIRAFTSEEARAIVKLSYGGHLGRKPGLVIANNVLAHVAEPLDFMRGLSMLLAADAVAVVQFQYFPDLLFGNEWDHIYHEHRSFLSLHSAVALASRVGLEVVDAHHSPMQGGSMRITLAHAGAAPKQAVQHLLERECRMGLNRLDTYANWQSHVDYSRDRICDLVFEAKRKGQVAGYGASAKSATLLNYCGFSAQDIAWIEDVTPYKIGNYAPGSHIPVRAPGDERPASYLLLIWNYLGDVLRREQSYLAGGGRFIIPIPHPMVI